MKYQVCPVCQRKLIVSGNGLSYAEESCQESLFCPTTVRINTLPKHHYEKYVTQIGLLYVISDPPYSINFMPNVVNRIQVSIAESIDNTKWKLIHCKFNASYEEFIATYQRFHKLKPFS